MHDDIIGHNASSTDIVSRPLTDRGWRVTHKVVGHPPPKVTEKWRHQQKRVIQSALSLSEWISEG